MGSKIKIDTRKVSTSRIDQVDFQNISFGKVYSDHMFYADYKDGEWGNFTIEAYGAMPFTPALAAIHYGQSIFEGLKTHKNDNGELLLFRPWENAKRLNESAVRMCIPELPEEIFMEGLTSLLKLDYPWVPSGEGTSLYVRPFMFATDEYVGIRPSDSYRFLIFTCPVGDYYSEPVRVKIETKYSRSFEGGCGAAKTAGNYAASLYPAREALSQGYHQLIWTDGATHKFVEESGTMNVMFIIGDTLMTSEVGNTVLKGITRNSVLTLAKDYGLKVEERPVSVEEIVSAAKDGSLKEAFGTGTAATIAHISTIGHEGNDYDLPAVETRKFSAWVLNELDAIKTGRIEDKHNWIYKV